MMTESIQFRVERLIRSRDDSWEDFEGPLDMILLLLSRDKIEIQDVSIAHLVEQYIATLAEWERMDIEIATEFTVMASHLVYLKTRMLLTVGDGRDEEVDTLLLALQKRQRDDRYRAIQWVADQLTPRAGGFDYITKPPSPHDDRQYRHRHSAADLRAAYMAFSERIELLNAPAIQNFAGIVGREHYPVSAGMDKLVERLTRDRKISFVSMLRECGSRSERIALFLAVLELCKDGRAAPVDEPGGLVLVANDSDEKGAEPS
jgi:segregation and condensation protein A